MGARGSSCPDGTPRAESAKANAFQREDGPVGRPLDALSPSLKNEVEASLERALRMYKAETIAADVNRKRSTVYRWQAAPEDVPIGALPVLAKYDPDPEFLARVAGVLLAAVSSQALARQTVGKTLMLLQEVSPGKWAR